MIRVFRSLWGLRSVWCGSGNLSQPERVIGQINLDRVALDSKTAVTRWCGEKIDYGLVMDGLRAETQLQPPDSLAGSLASPWNTP